MDYPMKKFSDLPQLDRKIIEGIPWAEALWNTLEQGLNKTFLYWCQIVLNMGDKNDMLESWVKTFIDTYEETCCEMVCDMENAQGKVVEKIEKMLQKIQGLCQTLQIEMPVIGKEQLSLCQEQYQLQKRIEEYEQLIETRLKEINRIRDKQLILCKNLGKQPKILRDSPLPSSEEIEEFQRYTEELESEKFNRLENFFSIKEQLVEIVKELNFKPSSKFEEEVLSADDSIFLLTDENMEKLNCFHKNLNKQLNNVKEEISHLRNKLDAYWNLLDFDLKEREEFRQKYIGNSLNVLDALRSEVKRCEELKRANIKVFIDKLRKELDQLWAKCHCTEAAKIEFAFFFSDCYNEDLLELHEVELAKWKSYYEKNKDLLSLLEKHKQLWKKMIALEESAAGPDRYNNRGGRLLMEEKERNKLAKQIPHIEELIFNLAENYKKQYDTSFTTFGETVDKYILFLHEERENIKKQKLSARKLRDQTKVTPAKSVLSLFPSTSHQNIRSATPLSTTKRKLPATPMTDDKKKRKLVLSEKKNNEIPKTPLPPLPQIKLTTPSGRSKRWSVERKKRIGKIQRRSTKKLQRTVDSNETCSTDYKEFQSELSNREDCRSTIIPSEIQATPVFHTPGGRKTPVNVRSTPGTPGSKTPKTPRIKTPRNADNNSKLTAVKSQLKLIF